MSLTFKGRWHFLLHHPEFQKHPLLVSRRLLCWLVCKKIGYAPEIKVHGSSRMRVYPERHGMGAPGLFYVFREGFENLVPYCVRAFVKPGQACFDIGANVGIWSLLMAEQCGSSGHVYSFEPLSTNLAHLRENVRLSNRTNITIVATALGKETSRVKIFTPGDPGRTSLAPESAGDRVEEVALRRLDDVWQELNCPEIALVKMDVEGSEPSVLEGGRQFFERCQPIVVSEINPRKLANMGKTPEDLFDHFRNLNYAAFQLNEREAKLEPIERCAEGDVVFVPRGGLAREAAPPLKS